jgi:hypothetical protein
MRGTTIGLALAAAALLQGVAIAQGTATLIIQVKTGDAPADHAVVRVLSSNGDEIAKGRSGEAIRVPVGIYTLAVKNNDLIDKPERRRRNVELRGGAPIRHTSEWPVARVKLITRVGGRAIKTKVVLHHQGGGDAVAEFQSGTFIRVSPGRYEANVHRGASVTKVSGLQFIEGAEQQIPVNIQ